MPKSVQQPKAKEKIQDLCIIPTSRFFVSSMPPLMCFLLHCEVDESPQISLLPPPSAL